jgi:hypothetical protein
MVSVTMRTVQATPGLHPTFRMSARSCAAGQCGFSLLGDNQGSVHVGMHGAVENVLAGG